MICQPDEINLLSATVRKSVVTELRGLNEDTVQAPCCHCSAQTTWRHLHLIHENTTIQDHVPVAALSNLTRLLELGQYPTKFELKPTQAWNVRTRLNVIG